MSRYGYLEVFQWAFEFEIMRVDCKNITHNQDIIHEEVEDFVNDLLFLKRKHHCIEDLIRAPVENIMYQILFGSHHENTPI